MSNDVAVYENSSPSLLAATPSLPRVSYEISDRRWADLRVQLEQRLYSLRQARISWWEHWRAIADATLPRRMQWLIAPNTSQRGSAINGSIKDPTAAQAMRICTAGMRSGLMSSSRPWFKLKSGVDNMAVDQPARQWFDDVQTVLYAIMSGSNFYTAGTQMFEDLIAFGTSPLLIYEDRQDIIRCQNPCCGEYYLGNDSTFRVDSFYRTFPLTLLQIIGRFGIENIGSELASMWLSKGASLDQEFIIAHAIEPNFAVAQPGQDPNLGVVPGGFAFREIYWLWGRSTEKPLSQRGFRDQPFIVPRWTVASNDPYGRSPGMDALPDILQLHTMTMRQAEAIEKMVRPPMVASAELKNQPSSILPGRVTYVSDIGKAGMKPMYEVKPDVADMAGLIEKIEKRVERWFFNDLFQMLENLEGVQPRTTIEISERRGEKLQVLGPVVEGVEQELASAIRRIYQIAKRRGMIPPLPPSLRGIPLHISIRSMIALAQEAAETASMERVVQVGAQMAQFFPGQNPLDNIDPDEFMQLYGERTAVPAKIMRSADVVKAMRAQQAKEMAAREKAASDASAATHTAPAVAGALKDISQTDVGGGQNALQMMLGQGGAAGGGLPQ